MFSSLFFFHSLPPSLPPPYPCPRCDRACALIDLPSNGSGHAALSHPPSPSPVCWPVENYRRTNNTTEGWRVVAACNTRPIEQFHVSIPEEMIGLTRHDRSRAARTGTRSAAIRPEYTDINFMGGPQLLDGLFGGEGVLA